MTIEQVDWGRMGQLDARELVSTVFDLLGEASYRIQKNGDSDQGPVTLVPRLLELRQQRPEHMRSLEEPIAALVRAVGLWNFLDDLRAPFPERLVAEAARVDWLQNRIFHREQWKVLDALFNQRNVILSAPKSFGRNLLIEALMQSNRYARVAIAVQTYVALDEMRERLIKLCCPPYQLVGHLTDAPMSDKVVFLGTPAELAGRTDINRADLLARARLCHDTFTRQRLGSGFVALWRALWKWCAPTC